MYIHIHSYKHTCTHILVFKWIVPHSFLEWWTDTYVCMLRFLYSFCQEVWTVRRESVSEQTQTGGKHICAGVTAHSQIESGRRTLRVCAHTRHVCDTYVHICDTIVITYVSRACTCPTRVCIYVTRVCTYVTRMWRNHGTQKTESRAHNSVFCDRVCLLWICVIHTHICVFLTLSFVTESVFCEFVW